MHHATLHRTTRTLPNLTAVDPADLVRRELVSLTIGDVRELIHHAYLAPVTAGKNKFVVVVAEQINHEAQNALLKLLEDPPAHTTFHFVVREQGRLLPTVLSRFAIHEEAAIDEEEGVADAFLRAPFAERLAEIARRVEEKDTAWQEALMAELELAAGQGALSRSAVAELLFVRGHLTGPGASRKMLLEHLALALPVLN